ncbi:MAG: Putative monooxygenase YcnE [Candidatus Erwinia impunctatus]|nr:Putative monooxygenase YcnE [Culicoides impunctatus]
MSQSSVLIVAKMTAIAGKGDALYQVLEKCVAPSRAEAGCLHYDLYRSVENAGIFLFHEGWKDTEAVALHNQQPHVKTLLEEATPLLASPPEITQI